MNMEYLFLYLSLLIPSSEFCSFLYIDIDIDTDIDAIDILQTCYNLLLVPGVISSFLDFLHWRLCYLEIQMVLSFFLLNLSNFVSFSYLTAIARTSIMIWKRSGKRGYPCLAPNLSGRDSSFSPLSLMLLTYF